MNDTVFTLLLRYVDERKEGLVSHLANGGAKTYEDYAKMTGMIQALTAVEDEIKGLEKRFMDE